MRRFAVLVLFIAAMLSVGAGVRYLITGEFMAYHAIVSGKSWQQLEPGIQTIVLGMLRIVGGGFLACGVSLLWLLRPLGKGEAWSRWAALTIAFCAWIPTLYVVLVLRAASPESQPPMVPTSLMLALTVVGVVAHFFGSRDSRR